MREVTPELLAACLDDIESGHYSLDDYLTAYPELGAELAELVTTAQSLGSPPAVKPDTHFRQHGRQSLLGEIAFDKRPVTKSWLARFWGETAGGWTTPSLTTGRRKQMPILIVVAVIALSLCGGGSIYASQDALPGDALYQVKTGVEGLQLTLASDDETRVDVYTNIVGKRVDEVGKASALGRTDAAVAAAEALEQHINEAEEHLDQAESEGKDISLITAQLLEELSRYQSELAILDGEASQKVQKALTKAAEKAEKRIVSVMTRGGILAIDEEPVIETTPTSAPTESPATETPEATPTSTSDGGTPTPEPTNTPTPSDKASLALTETIASVEDLADDPNISGQSYKGLLAKLETAQAALDRGKTQVAKHVLNAFLNQLNAFNQAGHISQENYEDLYARYAEIMDDLDQAPSDKVKANKHTKANDDDDRDDDDDDDDDDKDKDSRENDKKPRPANKEKSKDNPSNGAKK